MTKVALGGWEGITWTTLNSLPSPATAQTVARGIYRTNIDLFFYSHQRYVIT
jgi:hypothetical protein